MTLIINCVFIFPLSTCMNMKYTESVDWHCKVVIVYAHMHLNYFTNF